MIEFFSFAFFILVFFILIYKNIKLNIKIRSAKLEILKLSIDKTILSDKFAETLKNNTNKLDDTSEAFLKFISDSRDWAYQYIEDVQKALQDFVSSVKPEIEYFKQYGDISSMGPNYNSLKKITSSYEELVKILPKEEL